MGVICDCSERIVKQNIDVPQVISFDWLADNLLSFHNSLRKRHNSPDLLLNVDLCKMAENYAKELIINKNNDKIYKYNDEILGRNIYLSEIKPKQPEKVFYNWYEENKNYDYNFNYYQKNAAHFTQIVWKNTKEMGFGLVDEKNKFCLVVFYYPPGNIFGKFTDNVEYPNKKKK